MLRIDEIYLPSGLPNRARFFLRHRHGDGLDVLRSDIQLVLRKTPPVEASRPVHARNLTIISLHLLKLRHASFFNLHSGRHSQVRHSLSLRDLWKEADRRLALLERLQAIFHFINITERL